MSLQSELDAFKATWVERVGAETAQMMADENDALRPKAAMALGTGAEFPAMMLRDQLGREVDLAALSVERPLVITFYRGGWCPYCSLELRAYQKALPEIEAHGARLVAISPETPDNTLSTAEKNDLSFTVLSDTNGALAELLGIRFDQSEAVRAFLVKAGRDLPAHNGDGGWSLPMPATYVVARGGEIALAHVDPDYRKRLEPEAAIAVLAALDGNRAA